jgi:hypothetical protein
MPRKSKATRRPENDTGPIPANWQLYRVMKMLAERIARKLEQQANEQQPRSRGDDLSHKSSDKD